MLVQIAGRALHLQTEQIALRQFFTAVFAGFERDATPQLQPPIRLQARLTPQPPQMPSTPDFVDANTECAVQGVNGRFHLTFRAGGTTLVDLDANTLSLTVLEDALQNGRLQDMLFTGLAPLLRRQGVYLVHAFAAARDGECLLLVGPSGSGKTTAGLSLLAAGWQFVANDVVALERRGDSICAWRTPGPPSVRPSTWTLLPRPTHLLTAAPSAAYPIRTLVFPHITPATLSQLTPQPRGVALATLMQESVDRWDGATLRAHLALLQQVCVQTAVYTLASGPDVALWPQLLPAVASA